MIRKRTTRPSHEPQTDIEQIARQIVLRPAGQRKPLRFGTPTHMTGIMCEKCEQIDKRIARYQRVLLSIGDQVTIDRAKELIADLKAQKVALHPKQSQ